MFLVPLDQPGVEVQAVYTLSGERTNITFYNDLVRRGPLAHRRGRRRLAVADARAPGRALGAVRRPPRPPRSTRPRRGPTSAGPTAAPIDATTSARGSAAVATDLEVAQLLEQRVTWMEADGRCRGRGPDGKLFSTEAMVRRAEELTELVGPDALRSRLDPTALERRPHRARPALLARHRRSTPAPARSSATSSPSGLRPPPLVTGSRRSGGLLRARRPPPTLFI